MMVNPIMKRMDDGCTLDPSLFESRFNVRKCNPSLVWISVSLLSFASSMAVVEADAPIFEVDRANSILAKNAMFELVELL